MTVPKLTLKHPHGPIRPTRVDLGHTDRNLVNTNTIYRKRALQLLAWNLSLACVPRNLHRSHACVLIAASLPACHCNWTVLAKKVGSYRCSRDVMLPSQSLNTAHCIPQHLEPCHSWNEVLIRKWLVSCWIRVLSNHDPSLAAHKISHPSQRCLYWTELTAESEKFKLSFWI